MTDNLAHALFSATVSLSAACLLLAALRPVLKRLAGASALYLSWLLVPLLWAGLVLPPMPPSLFAVPASVAPALTTVPTALAVAAQAAPGHALAWLLAWGGGAFCLLAVLVRGHWRFVQSIQRQGRRWVLPAGASPVLVGLWPARVALPSDFRQCYSKEQRRLVLMHERIHAQRGDNAWTLLALMLLVLQWFNPLAWLALQRFKADQELACDAAVLRQFPQARKPYMQALVKAHRAGPAFALASSSSSHPLIERIAMLQHFERTRPWLAALCIAACVSAAYAARESVPASPPVQDGFTRVRLDVSGQFKDQALDARTQLTQMGHALPIVMKAANGRFFAVHVNAMPAGTNSIKLTTSIWAQPDEPIARPVLLVPNGETGRVQIDLEGGVLTLDIKPSYVVSSLYYNDDETLRRRLAEEAAERSSRATAGSSH